MKRDTVMWTSDSDCRRGISLLEMIVVVTVIGILAVIVVPRFSSQGDEAKRNACRINRGNIEVQCQLWLRQKGTAPQSTLSDIGGNTSFFPAGLPKCPVDGSSYSIDTATVRVSGHAH